MQLFNSSISRKPVLGKLWILTSIGMNSEMWELWYRHVKFNNVSCPFLLLFPDAASVIPDWNFYKYLVDQSGQVIGAWGTRTAIQDIFDNIQAAVDKAKLADKSDTTREEHGEEQKMNIPDTNSDVKKDEL